MSDFWMAGSGRYAGYRIGQDFFDAHGRHVGIFNGNDLHSKKTGGRIAVIVREKYLGAASGGSYIGVHDAGYRGGRNLGSIGGSGTGHGDPFFE